LVSGDISTEKSCSDLTTGRDTSVDSGRFTWLEQPAKANFIEVNKTTENNLPITELLENKSSGE
jgi:hypothetical protein